MEYTIFRKILNINYTRRQVNLLLLIVCSFFLRNFIDILIYGLLKSGYQSLDFTLSVIITVLLTSKATYIERVVKVFEEKLLRVTNYMIDNYSYQRYKTVRKIFIALSSTSVLIYLYFVEITSVWLMWSVAHFLICCFIIDKLEDWENHQGWPGLVRTFIRNQAHKSHLYINEKYGHRELFKTDYNIVSVKQEIKKETENSVNVNGHKIPGTYP